MKLKPKFPTEKAASPALEVPPGLAREDQLFVERLADPAPKIARLLAARAQALETGAALPRERTPVDRAAWQAFYRAALPLPVVQRDYWTALLLMNEAPLSALAALESALSLRHPAAPGLLRVALHLQEKHKLCVPLAGFEHYTLTTAGVQIAPAKSKADTVSLQLPRPPAAKTWFALWDRPGSVLMGLATERDKTVTLTAVPYPEYAKRKAPELWVGEARRWIPLDDTQFLLLGSYWNRRDDLAERLEALSTKRAMRAEDSKRALETAQKLVALGALPAALDAVEVWVRAQEAGSAGEEAARILAGWAQSCFAQW